MEENKSETNETTSSHNPFSPPSNLGPRQSFIISSSSVAAAQIVDGATLTQMQHSLDPSQNIMQVDYLKRRYRRKHENPEKIRELLVEQKSTVDNLKTAIETKMEIAVIGVLNGIITSLDAGSNDISTSVGKATVDGGDRQRALFRCGICPVVCQALLSLGGVHAICEKALIATAYLCRFSEENKSSVCLENAKDLGVSGACELIVGALKRHQQERKVIEAACDAIRSMCALESNRERFGNAGACEAVTGCLIRYHSDAEITSWLCRVIGHLANNNDANREALGNAGAVQNSIIAIQKFPTNLNVCTEVCWALRHMGINENNRARFANDYGPESIVAVFKSHVSSEPFSAELCKAAVNMISSEDDDLIPRFADSGIIHLALKAIKKSPDSETLANWVMHALYYVACDPKSVPKLLATDVLEILSSSLEKHAGHEPMAEWGSMLVHKLIQVTNSANISARMRQAGLCEMTVSAVQRQVLSRRVSSVGCQAIGDLAQDKDNQVRLSTAGAHEAAVVALKRHIESIDVVFNSCFAIHYLCMTQNNVSWMGANGACEAVTSALTKHSVTSEPVAKNALDALASLAYKDEGNQNRIFHASGCQSLVNALRIHAKSAGVAENACRAIYNLCADNQNVSDFGKKGSPQLVVAVLQEHASNAAVVTQALLAVHSLAVKTSSDLVHKGNTRKLVDKGAVEVVVSVMQMFRSNPNVQRAGAMAIASLGRLSENCEKLGAAGGCDLLFNAFKGHISNAPVVGKIALAIDVLSQHIDPNSKSSTSVTAPRTPVSETNKAKFVNLGTIDILIEALQRHESNATTVANVFRSLVTLGTYQSKLTKVHTESSLKLYLKVNDPFFLNSILLNSNFTQMLHIKLLKAHEKVPSVAEWGINLIYCCAIDDNNRSKLGENRACEIISSILSKHGPKNSIVSAWSCKAIVELSKVEANKVRFNTTETCIAVVNAVRNHPSDDVVSLWGTSAILSLAAMSQNKIKLVNAGVFEALSLTLSAQMAKDSSAQVNKTCLIVCRAVAELSSISQEEQLLNSYTNLVSSSKICETLSSTLAKFTNSYEVATAVCQAVSNLCNTNQTFATKFVINNNFHESVMLSLKAVNSAPTDSNAPNLTASLFVQNACNAIFVLTKGNSKAQLAFHAIDVVDTIGAILISFKSNEASALSITKAIRSLCQGCKENQFKVSKSNSIVPTCLLMMKTHLANEYVVENSAWILGNIEYLAINRGSLRGTSLPPPIQQPSSSSSGGLLPGPPSAENWVVVKGPNSQSENDSSTSNKQPSPTPNLPPSNLHAFYSKPTHWDLLLSALQTHQNKPGTVKSISSAVSLFAEKGRISHSSICDCLVSCLEKHNENDQVVHKILFAIGSLARTHIENSSRFTKHDLCETVDQLLSGYYEGNIAIYGILTCITGLANNSPENQQTFYNFPKLNSNVANVFWNELDNEQIAQYACSAISALSNGHRGNQHKLRNTCSFLAEVLTTHKQSPHIIIEAFRAISHLAHNNIGNRNKLGANGVCSAVPMAASFYFDDQISRPLFMENSLLYWIIRAIADLAANNPNNQAKLGMYGACELLVRVLKREHFEGHEEQDAKLFAATLWAVGNLVQLGKGPSMVLPDESEIGGLSHHSSFSLGAYGPATHLSSMTNLGRTGSTSLFSTVASFNRPSDADTMMRSNSVSSNTSGKAVKNTTRFFNAGIAEPSCLPALLFRMSLTHNSSLVAQWGCRAINNLSKNTSIKGKLIDSGVIDTIGTIAEKHAKNPEVLEWAKIASKTLQEMSNV
eukprot:gene4281-6066_t